MRSSQCLGVDEAVEHLEGGLGLVHGDHVASVVHLHEGEASRRTDHTRRLAVHVPRHVHGVVEGTLSRPGHVECPGLVAEPVADVVLVTSVDLHTDASGELLGDVLLVVAELVSNHAKGHLLVAVLPSHVGRDSKLGTHRVLSKEGLHVGEVVAKGLDRTLDAHVVHVLAAQCERLHKCDVAEVHGLDALVGRVDTRCLGGHVVARPDEPLALGHGKLHDLVHGGVHGGGVAVGGCSHVGVLGVLHLRVHKTVSDRASVQVDDELALLRHLVLLPDALCDGRDVVSCVRLTEDVERQVLVLRVCLVELLQEVVHVAGDHVLVLVEASSPREAGSGGLVNVDEGGVVVPAVGVQCRALAVLVHLAGSVLSEQRNLRRATRSSSQPQHDGVLGGVVARLKAPVEVLLQQPSGQRVVSVHLLHVGVAQPTLCDVLIQHTTCGHKSTGECRHKCAHHHVVNVKESGVKEVGCEGMEGVAGEKHKRGMSFYFTRVLPEGICALSQQLSFAKSKKKSTQVAGSYGS